ncbi:MAG: sugar phosphate nucleotidyltransferase [Candidatus Kapaibacterium sp.]
MKAVIMAGGFGTRLRPLTCSIPKPMAPMVNRPMMYHIVTLLTKLGIREVLSLLYYQPEVITTYFGNGSAFGIDMHYVQSEADFGTAGSVRNAYEFLDERFIIISGDVLTDFDLTHAIEFHKQKKAKATIVLTRVPDPLSFGVVMVNDDQKVTRFLEKPQWGEVFSDTINTGIYILEPEVLDLIPYKRDYDFSKDLFPQMLADDLGLYGYIAEGYWRDIGNLTEYQMAHIDALKGVVKLEIPGKRRGQVYMGEGTFIADDVQFEGTVVLGDNVKIGRGAMLADTVIGDGALVESGAAIRNSVIWPHTRIGKGAHITDDVICTDVEIGNDVVIAEHVFVGDRCRIGDGARLMANIKLWPDKEVESRATLSTSLVWADRWTREIFTDARISGLSNIEMNPEFGAKLGAALGAFAGKGRAVAISRDADNVSRMIHRAISTGLMSAGVQVNDLHTTPIPLTRSELRNGKQVAGVHVRKSPHDRRKTDIIFFSADGKDMAPGKTKTIERLFFGEEYQRAPYDEVGGIYFPERTNESYIARFLESLDEVAIRDARFKIAFDFSYGVASVLLPNLLGSLGPEVVSLNAYLDPTRMTREREEVDAALKKLGEVVISLGYDFGFIIDPGAEKIHAVSETGEAIPNYRLLSIVTKLVLETNKGTIKKIAVPIVASSEVEMIAREYGVEVIYTRNNHSAMMDATNDKEVAFVGGTRGGFIFPDFLFSIDGMYCVAKILELVARTGLTLGQLNTQLPRRAAVERAVECPWELKGKVMRKAMEHSEGYPRLLVDGVKIFLEDNEWALLIPDKERPIFHIVVETDQHERSAQLALEYERLVKEWKEEPVALP